MNETMPTIDDTENDAPYAGGVDVAEGDLDVVIGTQVRNQDDVAGIEATELDAELVVDGNTIIPEER